MEKGEQLKEVFSKYQREAILRERATSFWADMQIYSAHSAA